MLAAGVAVLSMCACTEANEFTPSTNNSTKKITEIKVSSNPSALGTRTVFHTGDDGYAYGAVTWEKDDQLYFFKENTNTNPQIFTCDAAATGPYNNYDWCFFKTSGAGLEVGKNYYAYYFPEKVKENQNFGKYGTNITCSAFYLDHYLSELYGGSEAKVLKKFMSDYDLLMSSAYRSEEDESMTSPVFVQAQDPMENYIYMDHAFALITVDVECAGMGHYKDYTQLPSIYQAELVGLTNDDKTNCFANRFKIDSNGQLTFSKDEPKTGSLPYIHCNFDNEEMYCVTDGSVDLENKKERQKISFYFLVRNEIPVEKLLIYLDTENDVSPTHENSVDKFLTITLSKGFSFIPGKCYKFGLKVDYGAGVDETTQKESSFDSDSHWKEIIGQKQIILASYPSGMNISEVVDDAG